MCGEYHKLRTKNLHVLSDKTFFKKEKIDYAPEPLNQLASLKSW